MFSPARRALLFCLLGLALVGSAFGFALTGYRWPTGSVIVMHLELTRPISFLQDGSASWNDSAADALQLWNLQLDHARFTAGSPKLQAARDGSNDAFFANNIYGETFGPS